tara:strand:+ start:543 stop:767 length:225 start_codon:yes stop_codon:yes gene_type:complete
MSVRDYPRPPNKWDFNILIENHLRIHKNSGSAARFFDLTDLPEVFSYSIEEVLKSDRYPQEVKDVIIFNMDILI